MPERKRKRERLYDEPLPAIAVPGGTDATRHRDPDVCSKIEEAFVWRYTSHYEPARAAIEAGYQSSRAHIVANRLLAEPRVKRLKEEIEADRLRRSKFDGDVFFAKLALEADADVTELIETWIPPCRYCWGQNNEYQRTHAEFERDWDAHMRLPNTRAARQAITASFSYGEELVYGENKERLPFDQKGGPGYDPSQPPNPGCPNCHGLGEFDENGVRPFLRVKDSRHLSDAGRAIYAGGKQGPRGFEALLRDRDGARSLLANCLKSYLELRSTDTGVQSFSLRPVNAISDNTRRVTKVERIVVHPPRYDEDEDKPEFT